MNYRKTKQENSMEMNEKVKRIIDMANNARENHNTQTTDFLNPYEVESVIKELNQIEISYMVDGGVSFSERKIIYLYPEYMNREDIVPSLRAIKITGSSNQYTELKHKDYLGSILAMGIKREKVGEVIAYDDYGVAIVCENILEFIKMNLCKVKNINVTVQDIEFKDILKKESEYKEDIIVLSSLRLDLIVSKICGLSRNDSKVLINSDRVKINWCPIKNSSFIVSKGDMISIRGFGRSLIYDELGTTKKGNLKMKVRKYI